METETDLTTETAEKSIGWFWDFSEKEGLLSQEELDLGKEHFIKERLTKANKAVMIDETKGVFARARAKGHLPELDSSDKQEVEDYYWIEQMKQAKKLYEQNEIELDRMEKQDRDNLFFAQSMVNKMMKDGPVGEQLRKQTRAIIMKQNKKAARNTIIELNDKIEAKNKNAKKKNKI